MTEQQEKQAKIFLDTATAEDVLNLIDWDNFTYKHWRFLHNYVHTEFIRRKVPKEIAVEGESDYDKIFRVFNAKIRVEQAIKEVERLCGKEIADRVKSLVERKWRDPKFKAPFKEWEMRDSIFSALTKDCRSKVETMEEEWEFECLFGRGLDFTKAEMGTEVYQEYQAKLMLER